MCLKYDQYFNGTNNPVVTVEMPTGGSKIKNFFSLYTNNDALKKQNSDKIKPRNNNLTAHQMCQNTTQCIPPFFHHETRFKIAPDYHMINCVVHKSMSTVITGLMCYLFNRKRFVSVDSQINMTEWEKASLCRSENGVQTIRQLQRRVKSNDFKNWSLSMITRDPVDRFISGYVDRCIRVAEGPAPCNGCDKNLTCFVLSEYERFMKQTMKKKLVNTFEDRHFYPQNWRCGLNRMRDQYEFIRYSSDPTKELMTDLFKIAQRQGVPKSELEYIEQELTRNRKTSHTTAYSPAREFYEKRLRENPFLMEYVVRMFYHDFVILGYSFPPGF
ncbi:unnamed protein product [Caenorhabditis angaria]|uniref:Carbohydrate sulfotransferase n=1 Tax=Caenorhabditis angaria TaxID=860376 RepID=A0A9P1N910_9PELO|nr:unnamed protein product [Caenorhabditis angaria]